MKPFHETPCFDAQKSGNEIVQIIRKVKEPEETFILPVDLGKKL